MTMDGRLSSLQQKGRHRGETMKTKYFLSLIAIGLLAGCITINQPAGSQGSQEQSSGYAPSQQESGGPTSPQSTVSQPRDATPTVTQPSSGGTATTTACGVEVINRAKELRDANAQCYPTGGCLNWWNCDTSIEAIYKTCGDTAFEALQRCVASSNLGWQDKMCLDQRKSADFGCAEASIRECEKLEMSKCPR